MDMKKPPVPDGALVIVEPLGLGVPVPGDSERRRPVEVVLDQFALVLIKMPVRKIALRRPLELHLVLVNPRVHGIDDIVPPPVQRKRLPAGERKEGEDEREDEK